jgi:hypothetical protein
MLDLGLGGVDDKIKAAWYVDRKLTMRDKEGG